MGEGKHLRFRVRERSRPAGSAIAFGLGPQLDRFRREGTYDLAFRLEENRWNGTVAPQLVVRHVLESDERYHALASAARRGVGGRGGMRGAPRDARSSRSSALDGSRVVSLYESETFRALMTEEPLLAQAA